MLSILLSGLELIILALNDSLKLIFLADDAISHETNH